MQVLHIADPDLPNTTTGFKTTPSSHLLCAADHPAQSVRWLWPNRIPLGKVTLLAGDPGLGKSLLALDLAARVTRALPFPAPQPPALPGVELPNNDQFDIAPPPPPNPANTNSATNPRQSRGLTAELAPGSVLILSANDDYHDTIRPRLDAAGADPARIFYLPAVHDLRHDFDKLRDAVESIPDCRLIIIDPINAYVGPSDAHFHTVVRRVLEPLAKLATEKSLAILAITHLNKSDGATIQRAAGSMGFVATARTIWTLARDPVDPTRTLLLPLKNNLAPTAPGLAFRISSHPSPTPNPNACDLANQQAPPQLETPSSTTCDTQYPVPSTLYPPTAPHLLWDPTPVTISPREALRPAPTPKPPRRPTDREEAGNFLREALAAGPRPANELLDAGAEHGFHRRTLQRAFHDLEGHTAKRGWTAGWWWSLGDYPIDDDPNHELLPPNGGDDVTYAHDVTFQAKMDGNEKIAYRLMQPGTAKPMSPSCPLSPSCASSIPAPNRPPTVKESMAYLDRAMNNRHTKKPKPK